VRLIDGGAIGRGRRPLPFRNELPKIALVDSDESRGFGGREVSYRLFRSRRKIAKLLRAQPLGEFHRIRIDEGTKIAQTVGLKMRWRLHARSLRLRFFRLSALISADNDKEAIRARTQDILG